MPGAPEDAPDKFSPHECDYDARVTDGARRTGNPEQSQGSKEKPYEDPLAWARAAESTVV